MHTKNKILVLVLFISLFFITKVKTETVEILPPTFHQEMIRIFGTKVKIAEAVFIDESINGFKNYNCYYYNSEGKRYSTFCKKTDKHKAWSVDCGKAQINVKGKVCPPELMTDEGQIKAIEKIYKQQGLKAWMSYVNGGYKKHLTI